MISLNLFSSIGLGLALAAPVGPIAMLCVRTTLRSGFWAGFSTGLGAAFADALVCFLVLSGLASRASLDWRGELLLRILSFLFLTYLGIKIVLSKLVLKEDVLKEPDAASLAKHFFGTFALTILSPLTFLSFAALFSVGIEAEPSTLFHPKLLASSGVLLGSAFWWFLLSGGLSVAREKLSPAVLRLINILSGGFIVIVAILILLRGS